MHPDTVDITDDFVSYISATFVLTCMHPFQLSQIIPESPGCRPDLLVSHVGRQASQKLQMKVHARHFSDIFWLIFGVFWGGWGKLLGPFLWLIWQKSILNNFLRVKKVKLAISQILTLYWGVLRISPSVDLLVRLL